MATMRTLVVLVCVVAATSAGAISAIDAVVADQWNSFKMENNKIYKGPGEERSRLKVFVENARLIARHNARYVLGLETYKLKANSLADLNHQEFLDLTSGFNKTAADIASVGDPYLLEDDEVQPLSRAEAIPAEIDWRTKGAVTAVKNQGSCGSCWAFSAIGAVEGQHFRKTGKLVSLSEQNLLDCSSHGCGGGYINGAFNFIRSNGGVDTEASYPYRAKRGNCSFNPKTVGATVRGYVKLRRGDENRVKQAVAGVGPLAVAIDARHPGFRFYHSGVFYDKSCGGRTGHAVLIVGYGTDKKAGDYWLVKNSWGRRWGDEGYIKMARNRNNHCSIASYASYPLV